MSARSAFALNGAAARSDATPAWSALQVAGWRLQRKCACADSGTQGSCAECDGKPLQRQLAIGPADAPDERDADRVADAVMRGSAGSGPVAGSIRPAVRRSAAAAAPQSAGVAPAAVHVVLSTPGQPLAGAARAFFESRFGHDFSRVRIHHDAAAAASARAVAAHAYTVGPHVVFDTGRYAPETSAGRRLLAHELTHVVQQQAGVLRREAQTASPLADPEDERNALPEMQLQRAPAIVGYDRAGPKADLGGDHESEQLKRIGECLAGKGPDPNECEPGTALTWADFKATPNPASRFGAVTASSIKAKAVGSQECAGQVLPGGPTGPTRIFQGVFDPARSWVKADVLNAADPAKNGSGTMVRACERAFDQAAAQRKVGVTWALRSDTACPAGAPPTGTPATTKAACKTTIAADFTGSKVADSPRLLKHEQFHFSLSCALTKKANRLLWGGAKFATLDGVIHTLLRSTQQQYDTETHHGCDAASQASWETEIQTGLPKVKLS